MFASNSRRQQTNNNQERNEKCVQAPAKLETKTNQAARSAHNKIAP